MKILQICTKVPYPPKDGGAAAVYALSRTFCELGHEVDVLSVNPEKHYINPNQLSNLPFTVYPVLMDTKPTILGAFYNFLFSKTAYHTKRFSSKDFKSKLIELLSKKKYDVVQIEGVYLCSNLSLIRKHSNALISLRAHNVEHLLWQDIANKTSAMLKKLYYRIQSNRIKKFETKQSSLVDCIVTISEPDEFIFKILNPTCKIFTIPFGIDTKAMDLNENKNIQTIFYIGALDWLPNQASLLWFLENIWPEVQSLFPGKEFHIAGRNAPNWLTKKLANQKQVVFHGEVESSAKFMQAYDLMVVPLFAGSGMRVKIIEGMNEGKVIIATDKACTGIPVHNNIHLRIANTKEEFVEAISKCINEPETNTHLITASKRMVTEFFDNFALASKCIDFYRQQLQ